MEFTLTEEQQELASTVRALLDKRSDSAAVRSAMASDAGYDRELWRIMCEQIGVAALPIPEEYDGVGASLFETAVVLEEVGRALAPSPLLATAIATTALLLHADEDARSELLPRIAGGEAATVAWDAPAGPGLVLDGATASILLALSADELSLLDIDAVDIQTTPALDPTLRLAEVAFAGGGRRIGAIEDDRPLRDVAASLATALQLGAARCGLDMTVAYAKERVQFGRPIGSFQAVKHRLADLLVLVEMSRSASWAATGAASSYVLDPTPEGATALRNRAAIAQAYCSEALDAVAAETIQLHGGIAITWEHDAHLVFKRAHALSQLFGRAHEHRGRITL